MNSAPIPSQSRPTGDGIEQIAASVRSGQVVLFLGAGVHASKPAPPGQPEPPSDPRRPLFAGALAEALARETRWTERFPKKPPKDHFQRVALDYELSIILDEQWKDWEQKGKNQGLSQPPARPESATEAIDLRHRGRARLAAAVQRAVTVGKTPSPALRALAELNFPLIITTNYDRLFEDALLMAGKNPTTAVYQPTATARPEDPLQDPSPQNPFIFKIHGDINTPESLVITDEDYIDFVLRMTAPGEVSPVPETFYFRLAKWPTLFIGYSLLDYNLRLLLKTLRHKKDRFPRSYSIDPWPDPLVARVWDSELGYVGFLANNLWEFVPELYQRVKGCEMPNYGE
jgi:SIR2-like domain